MDELKWCLKIKNGIKFTNPSEEEYESYSKKAKIDLNRIKNNEIPSDWVPIVAYYSAYYSIYSLLRILGLKSENHLCSIKVFE